MTPAQLRGLAYPKYLRTHHWQVIRRAALDHYGSCCTMCGNAGSIDVHHRTYERLGEERLHDLTVLCRDCHARFHEPAVPEPNISIEQIRAAWSRTVLPIAQEYSVPVAALLTIAFPARLAANTLTLTFPWDCAFHGKQINMPRNLAIVSDVLYEVTAHRFAVTVEISSKATA